MTTEQLIQQITVKRRNLHQLEEQLALLQAQCIHEYTETITYRKCMKCLKIESVHY